MPFTVDDAGRPVFKTSSTESILASQTQVRIYAGQESSADLDAGCLFLTHSRIYWSNASLAYGCIVCLKDVVKWETTCPLQQGPLIQEPREGRQDAWACVICAHSSNPSSASKCVVCGVQNMAQQEGSSRGRTRTSQKTDIRRSCPKCTLLNHVDLAFCEMCEAPLSSVDTKGSAAINGELHVVKLSFRGGGQPEFLKIFQKASGEKAWEKTATLQSSSKTASPNTGIGLSGIIKKIEETNQSAETNLSTAFSDLNSLMEKAAEMVKLADSIGSKLAGMKDTGVSKQVLDFRNNLLTLGIQDPVTKTSAGNSYFDQLARQISSFLDAYFEKYDLGMRMISTVDLYCVFNRARGLELISPQDLMTACQQFESQSLDYRLRSFQSGAIFVQAIECSDDKVSEKVLESVTNCSPHGLSAVGLSQKERISVVLAKEQLLMAEERGLLCRDVTIQGLIFYPNRFTSLLTSINIIM